MLLVEPPAELPAELLLVALLADWLHDDLPWDGHSCSWQTSFLDLQNPYLKYFAFS